MYPVKKMYLTEQKKLESEGREIFAPEFFEEALLNFLSHLGELQQIVAKKGNRKQTMIAYVHGFRSLLGVGIALHCQEDISRPNLPETHKKMSEQFFDIYEHALALRYTLKDHSFYALFSGYLSLGGLLGLNFDDISYVYENER